MADNTNKVTIDAAWFAELYAAKKDKDQYAKAVLNIAKERDNLRKHIEDDCASCPAVKERDELKAKLATSQNYEDVIAAKDREIEAVKDERNRLNAKVNELKGKIAAAERCIDDIETVIGGRSIKMQGCAAHNIIRAYREKKEDNQ